MPGLNLGSLFVWVARIAALSSSKLSCIPSLSSLSFDVAAGSPSAALYAPFIILFLAIVP